MDRVGTDRPLSMVLSPSEDKVTIEIMYEGEGDTVGIEVFDLVTKERLVTVDGSYVKATWVNDDCFLSRCLDSGVFIWNKREDGEWDSDKVFDGLIDECAVINNNEVTLVDFNLDHDDDDDWDEALVHVRSLSLLNGAVSKKCTTTIDVTEQGFSSACFNTAFVCDGLWLLISVRLKRSGPRQTGIYVYNLNTFEMVHFYSGGAERDDFIQATDCPRTFSLGGCSLPGASQFSVLKLGENGHLSEAQRFTIPGRHLLRAASTSQIVLFDLEKEQLQSFNAETFELERSWNQHSDDGVCVVSQKRKELFVAEDDLFYGVRTYCF